MSSYDVIVIGARCAGSPTAMLLASKGYRVLLLDRSRFPSDVLSAHIIHNSGVQMLTRWGLTERIAATGCPPIRKLKADLGPDMHSTIDYANRVIEFNGKTRPFHPEMADRDPVYAPRRRFLDSILLEAAIEKGAEFRQEFTVSDLLQKDGRVVGIVGSAGSNNEEIYARLVIGADGRHSTVARVLKPTVYRSTEPLSSAVHSYWSGLDLDSMEAYFREGFCIHVTPTNDGLACVGVSVAKDRCIHTFPQRLEENFNLGIREFPELQRRLAAGRREEPFVGTEHLPNFIRQAHGPGWALVGDSEYSRDPIMGQGISDAFFHAELLASAVHAGFSGKAPIDDCLARYEADRDRSAIPLYEAACQISRLEAMSPKTLSMMSMYDTQYEDRKDFQYQY